MGMFKDLFLGQYRDRFWTVLEENIEMTIENIRIYKKELHKRLSRGEEITISNYDSKLDFCNIDVNLSKFTDLSKIDFRTILKLFKHLSTKTLIEDEDYNILRESADVVVYRDEEKEFLIIGTHINNGTRTRHLTIIWQGRFRTTKKIIESYNQ